MLKFLTCGLSLTMTIPSSRFTYAPQTTKLGFQKVNNMPSCLIIHTYHTHEALFCCSVVSKLCIVWLALFSLFVLGYSFLLKFCKLYCIAFSSSTSCKHTTSLLQLHFLQECILHASLTSYNLFCYLLLFCMSQLQSFGL
jgi:hypothetical protein